MAETLGGQEKQLQAPQQGASEFVQSLFQPVTQGPTNENYIPDPIVRKGSLISFNYMFMKHDPYPMVIVTDIIYGNRIRGVNLNYLSFYDIKKILGQFGDNRAFSYKNIKYDRTLLAALNSFREYKWIGIRQLRKLDSDFLLQTINLARNYNPSQINEMRRAVQEQIKQKITPKANEIAEQGTLYTQKPTGTVGTVSTIPTMPASQPTIGGKGIT